MGDQTYFRINVNFFKTKLSINMSLGKTVYYGSHWCFLLKNDIILQQTFYKELTEFAWDAII